VSIECEGRWRHGEGIDHHDVFPPSGWHLNYARVPVPPVPKLTAEIYHSIRNLPEAMCLERKYQNEQF
jgi:hypothetical protein